MKEWTAERMREEIRTHLTERILPFWMGLRDDERGGYVGYVGYDLTREPEAVRGCILNSRILWFFSAAASALGDGRLMDYARHAYRMLERMTDEVNGGVYWALNADGSVADGTKHTYNQAFAIYALSAYADASGCAETMERALRLFACVEEHCTDEWGYLEAFTADWQPVSNEKLSENGVLAEKTMNTLLHVLEAYTELYRVSRDARVEERLRFLLKLLAGRVYNPFKRRQEVFFDSQYHSLMELHSYGHDIETSWLADRTLDVLGDEALTAAVRPMLLSMAEETFRQAWTPNGFLYENAAGRIDTRRVWWVQAEAVVGFVNAWQRTGESRYLDAACSLWDYIRRAMIDPREGSEWFWYVTEDGTPARMPIVEPWKCPYHNGRMALEVLRRLSADANL